MATPLAAATARVNLCHYKDQVVGSRLTPSWAVRSPHTPLFVKPPSLPSCETPASNLSAGSRWRHYGAMTSVQINDVPEETHAVLRRRAAAAAHQSLQEYLCGRLIEEASHPTVEEVLDRAGGRAGGSVSFGEATMSLREDRDRR